jgi:hypothetical protein
MASPFKKEFFSRRGLRTVTGTKIITIKNLEFYFDILNPQIDPKFVK